MPRDGKILDEIQADDTVQADVASAPDEPADQLLPAFAGDDTVVDDDAPGEMPDAAEVAGDPPIDDGTWSGRATAWAEELGINEQQRKAFPDEESFIAFAEHLYQSAASQMRQPQPSPQQQYQQSHQLPQQQQWMPNQQQPQQQWQQPQQQWQQPQQQQQLAQPPVPQVDLDSLDEPTANAFRYMQSQLGQQAQQIQSLVGVASEFNNMFSSQTQANTYMEQAQKWDAMFSRMDENLYGRGSSADVSSGAQSRRAAVQVTVDYQRSEMERRGDVLPPLLVHAHMVEDMLFREPLKAAAKKKSAQSVVIAGHATPRSKRTSDRKPVGGRDAAIAAVAALERKKGRL